MDYFTRMTFPVSEEATPQVTPQVKNLLKVVKGEHNRQELRNLSDRKYFRENYPQSALDIGLIEMTIPDKPKSSKQKYRLTEKGKQIK